MRKQLRLLPLLLFLFVLVSNPARSQVTTISYAGSGLTQGEGHDAFATAPTIDGNVHTTISDNPNDWYTIAIPACPVGSTPPPNYLYYVSVPYFDGTGIILSAASSEIVYSGQAGCNFYSNHYATDAYRIAYTFQPNTLYSITFNIAGTLGPPFSGSLYTLPYAGLGISLGTPAFTTNVVQAGLAQAALNGGINSNYNTDGAILDNNFLVPSYASYYPITATGANQQTIAPTNITMPSFTVPATTTGLNIEALPPLNGTVSGTRINSITITALGISGSTSLVCSSQTYTVNSPTAVTWSIIPSTGYIATITPNGNSCTVTRVNNGPITLTATNANGLAVSKSIDVGPPFLYSGGFTNTFDGSVTSPIGIYPYIVNSACTSYDIQTDCIFTGAAGVTWSKVSSSALVNYSVTGNNILFYLYGNGQNAIFEVDASNACGTTSYEFEWVAASCTSSGGGGGGCNTVSVTPNPSTTTLTIHPDIPPPCNIGTATLTEVSKQSTSAGSSSTAMSKTALSPTPATEKTTPAVIRSIRLYSAAGNLVKDLSYGEGVTGALTIGVGDLPAGTYYLLIREDKRSETQKIVISH